jgi:hypothetical protein
VTHRASTSSCQKITKDFNEAFELFESFETMFETHITALAMEGARWIKDMHANVLLPLTRDILPAFLHLDDANKVCSGSFLYQRE